MRSQKVISKTAPLRKRKAVTKSKASYSGELPQYFDAFSSNKLTPSLGISAEIFYHNASKGINKTDTITIEVPLYEDGLELQEAQELHENYKRLSTQAPSEANYAPLPTEILEHQAEKKLPAKIQTFFYQTQSLQLYRVRSPKLDSKADETLQAFKIRFQDLLNQKKDAKLSIIEKRYATKEQRIASRIEKAEARLEKEESDVSAKTTDTLVSAGLAIFGAFFGGRSSASRIGSTISKGTRISKEKADVQRAENEILKYQEQYQDLQDELLEKIDELDTKFAIDNYTIEPYQIRPKKRDITIKDIALIWRSEKAYM